MFDHVAHLGGAAFGVVYYVWGEKVWAAAKRRRSSHVNREP